MTFVRSAAVLFVLGCGLVAAAQPLRGTVEQHNFLGPITQRPVLFNIYLPEGYADSAQRYPVIYHLHGLGGSQGGPHNVSVPASFEAAEDAGVIGPVIIVFPNGYTDSFWADSIDVRTVDKYEATAEIFMGKGAKPADDPRAFDARQVIANLQPRIVYPEAKK